MDSTRTSTATCRRSRRIRDRRVSWPAVDGGGAGGPSASTPKLDRPLRGQASDGLRAWVASIAPHCAAAFEAPSKQVGAGPSRINEPADRLAKLASYFPNRQPEYLGLQVCSDGSTPHSTCDIPIIECESGDRIGHSPEKCGELGSPCTGQKERNNEYSIDLRVRARE
jgi:hypothetical protein